MIKLGIINKNANVQKLDDEEEIIKFANKSDEQINQATNEFLRRNEYGFIDINYYKKNGNYND